MQESSCHNDRGEDTEWVSHGVAAIMLGGWKACSLRCPTTQSSPCHHPSILHTTPRQLKHDIMHVTEFAFDSMQKIESKRCTGHIRCSMATPEMVMTIWATPQCGKKNWHGGQAKVVARRASEACAYVSALHPRHKTMPIAATP